MKKLVLAVFSVLIHQIAQAQAVSIPDPYFLKALIQNGVDTNHDGKVQISEAELVTRLNVSYDTISDLTGIEYFTSLDSLFCIGNLLTTLDLSMNTQLVFLDCYYNQLKTLNISQNTSLTLLNCYSNALNSLDVSKNTALTWLQCGKNLLSSLDVSKNVSLTFLESSFNLLTTIDIASATSLKYLLVKSNSISSINLSENSSLTILNCSSNHISTLDVSHNPDLYNLDCSDNQLTYLDVSSNQKLDSLSCESNPSLMQICINNEQISFEETWKKDPPALWSTSCGDANGLENVFLSSPPKSILRILDMQGQEVTQESAVSGMYVYQYKDGTTKKMIR